MNNRQLSLKPQMSESRLVIVIVVMTLSNVDKCRPEAAGDVISGMALEYVGADVPANIGDSTLNSGRIIQLLAGRTNLRICVQYLIAFCSRLGEARHIRQILMALTVPKSV